MKAVNLLPPDMRGASKASSERTVVTDDSSGFGAYVLLGVLAFAVLALAGVVLTGNAIKDREAQLASTQTQQQQVAARASALKPYADFDQMASERVATVRDLAGRRFDWEQVVRDLSRAIPANVTLSELTGNVSTDTGGAGGSTLREAISAPAVTVKGCTTGQTDVARLMARLRNVDGVTRVSLAKSEKTDLSQGQGAGSAVPVTGDSAVDRSAPCGEGEKPEFEMIMFFEGDAEAATGPSATPATPGQAAGGTTPAPTGEGTSTTTSTTGQTGGESTPAPATASPTATPTQGGVTP
jgi:Tfp pilus assembly protein PilN